MNPFTLLIVGSIILFVIFLIIYIDYRGPSEIILRNDVAFGINCLRASDLIVQEFDAKGNLWASRGMIIYRLEKNERKFKRIAHVPTGFSILWLNNFTPIRKYSLRSECIEIVITEKEEIHALSAGKMWYAQKPGSAFKKTLQLPHYGYQVGRGFMSTGITKNANRVFFGEYFRNLERASVKIFRTKPGSGQWEVAYEFKPDETRHIHTLQADPFSNKLWVGTGDNNSDAFIGWSDRDFDTLQRIGYGSQRWRACQFVFTEAAVYWGTDTDDASEAGIYRWDKNSNNLEKIVEIDGAIYFGTLLTNGIIVMSADREGFINEIDDKTSLYFINEKGNLHKLSCGTWEHRKPGIRFSYAKLRLQRGQNNDFLAVSCLNQIEMPESELLIYSATDIHHFLNSKG
jgi:hypothetical protein